MVYSDDTELAQYPGGLRKAVEVGLSDANHTVDIIDLHHDNFLPEMTVEGRKEYHSGKPLVEADVINYASRIQVAEAMVFVYRAAWTGLPARLKGFLDRTFVPGVGFKLVDGKVRRALTDVRRLVVVAMHDQSRLLVRQSRDVGRRSLMRSLRLIVNPRCQLRYLPIYDCESLTDDSREIKYAFLVKVKKTLSGL